jgi:hypothetical protein
LIRITSINEFRKLKLHKKKRTESNLEWGYGVSYIEYSPWSDRYLNKYFDVATDINELETKIKEGNIYACDIKIV